MPVPVDRSFSARLDCHYLLLTPPTANPRTPLVVTLHGFGSNPEAMLDLTARLFDPEDSKPVIVSLQGPNQFFLSTATREVGYGWITNRRPAESIRLHHEMVRHAAEETGREFGIPPERSFLCGFSQSVGLNYRFVATYTDLFRGVLAICGGLPGDWDEGNYGQVIASVLHIARRSDDYYSPEVTCGYTERLRRRAADVEFHLIEGGHQMPSGGQKIVAPWIRRLIESG
jgi:phospholipase/carboxylesterase